MKVKNILSRIVDNYYKIVIEVFDSESNMIKVRYYIEPHATNHFNIPADVKEKEVGMIIPHFDSLVIAVRG